MANYTDSIAVAVLEAGTILQGIGSKMILYSSINGDWSKRSYDFNFNDKIHGIETARVQESWTICVYGGRYLAICTLEDGELNLVGKCKLSDFISSARINPVHHHVVDIVTTYNVAVKLKLREKTFKIIQKSVCEERSTLYCSHIRYGDNEGQWTKMRIFGGTAFGEVLVWSPDESGGSNISYRFSTPMGVLFSITTSEDFTQLFTTSDDRSVRFWSLKWGEDNSVQSHSLKLTCFGHMGRVFQSALTDYLGQSYLITVGEDARICCWDMSGNLIFRREIQSGPTLWNVAIGEITESGEGKGIYVTTSNGGLEVVDFRDALNTRKMTCVGKDLFEAEYPAKVRFLSPNRIICVTNVNSLKLLVDYKGSWSVSCSIKLEFKSTVLEVSKGNYLAVAGFAVVAIYNCTNDDLQLQTKSKNVGESLIRSVHWLPERNLLVVNDKGEGFLLNETLDLVKRISLPSLGKERWSTSVMILKNYLLVADRHGGLSSFYYGTDKEEKEAPMRKTLRRVHGQLGITEMKQKSSNESSFNTMGHDGMVRTVHLDEVTGELKVWRSQKVGIKWVERMAGNLLMGFNDNHFTIWNMKERRMVVEIDCGGGHRFWDLVESDGEARFVFIKNRQLQLANISLNHSRILLPGAVSNWHATSTNCLKTWTVHGSQFVFSGGEEALVKIHELIGGALIYRDELTVHIANIRAMDLRVLDESTALLYSGGGRAQMCVHRLRKRSEIGEELEIQEIVNYMLKGSDLVRGRKNKEDFDPETRFMCLFVNVNGEKVFAGCSDGFIRVFHCNEEKEEITLKSEIFYGKCVLQITGLRIDGQRMMILTMATDGRVNFWPEEQLLGHIVDPQPVFVLSHHESGINAFDCKVAEGSEDEFWIVTGGDDQKIVGTKVRIEGNGSKFTVESSFDYPYRHRAQLSGIKILGDKFLSVSVDQLFLENSLESANNFRKVCFTSVSDAKGLSLLSDNKMLIYGAGVEVIEW